MAADVSGHAYVVGATASADFPTVDAPQREHAGGTWDGFVAKLAQGGRDVLYGTYLGGTDADRLYDLALDPFRKLKG